MNPQNLANVLWAYATLALPPAAPLLGALGRPLHKGWGRGACPRLGEYRFAQFHLADVPFFPGPCGKRTARVFDGGGKKSIPSTCRPFAAHLKGRHVSAMETRRAARRWGAKHIRATCRPFGFISSTCRPFRRIQDTCRLFLPSARRAVLWCCGIAIKGTCRPFSAWVSHRLDVPPFVVTGWPSKARAALSRRGL